MDTAEETQMGRQTDPLPPDIEILVALRKAGYTTITDLATDSGIPRANLSRILRGHRYEDAIKNLRAVASKLHLTLDELVTLIEEARVNPLYLHLTDELDYYVGQVDGLTVYLPNRSA